MSGNMAVTLLFLLLTTWFCAEGIQMTEPSCQRFFYEQEILKNQLKLEHRMDVNEEKTNLWREEMKRDLDQCRQELDAIKVSVSEKYKELEDKIEAVTKETDVKSTELENKVGEVEHNVKETIEEMINMYVNETTGKTNSGGVAPIVVFKARGVSDKSPSRNARMVFTSVVVNEGGGYDTSTGYFTVPVAGLYLFTVQMGEMKDKWCQMHIMADGSLIGTISFQGGNTGASTSGNGMAVLSKGDKVYIKSFTSSSSNCIYEDSDDWSSFSGVLLNAGV